MRLCVLHNLYFYNTMMEEIRDALDNGCYEEYKQLKTPEIADLVKSRIEEAIKEYL